MQRKCVVTLAILVLASALGVQAQEDEPGNFGLGYHGVMFGDFAHGISGRTWAAPNIGVEFNVHLTNVGIEVETDALDSTLPVDIFETVGSDVTLYLLTGKFMYAPVVRPQSRFYVGMEAGFGKVSADVAGFELGQDLDILVISPLFGVEYRFEELPELGFDWEVGYRLNAYEIEPVKLDLNAVSAAIGLHYYF